MKLYNTSTRCHRISLLSKHLSSTKRSHNSKRRLNKSSFLSSNQKKSRYHYLKSCKNKHQMYLKQEHKKLQHEQKQQKEEEYLTKLRQEAYADLHAQLQHYNDDFITRMRYMESNNDSNELLPSVPSTDSLCSTSSEESTMQNLVELFEAGSVKDYSQLIEWESFKNPPNYFECQGEYGDLW